MIIITNTATTMGDRGGFLTLRIVLTECDVAVFVDCDLGLSEVSSFFSELLQTFIIKGE